MPTPVPWSTREFPRKTGLRGFFPLWAPNMQTAASSHRNLWKTSQTKTETWFTQMWQICSLRSLKSPVHRKVTTVSWITWIPPHPKPGISRGTWTMPLSSWIMPGIFFPAGQKLLRHWMSTAVIIPISIMPIRITPHRKSSQIQMQPILPTWLIFPVFQTKSLTCS